MPSNTTKYVIPYALSSDTVAGLAATIQNLANRVDLLLGEAGQYNIASVAANTNHLQAITLGRTYPGNNGATVPGVVIVELPALLNAANPWNFWLQTWTGSASTITGFTIVTQWASAQTNRLVNWRFLPVL